MPSISCFYYRLWTRKPFTFIFVKFEKFVKVMLDHKAVILTNEELASNPELFQMFVLSLLLTENTSKVDSVINDDNKISYGVSSYQYWNSSRPKFELCFNELEKSRTKNPLNAREPTRASSDKKVRKFFKSFREFYENEMIKDPSIIVEEYLDRHASDVINYFNRYIEHECKVQMLSSIFHNFGRDIYASVNRFI